ncbi:MAG: tRNA (adenine(22)-N(1))-methyltransferase TrmK [Lactobacillales bacterium]|jgi:tRNA (adenine22-N1)-methyltransferase|nr:tRNA (adenine(22)-N(1))-methyltransferase TrmK [Lactobacillales bacterium]
MNLSKRLARVADFVPINARLADIGSDHAYLPVALMLEEKIEFAVAGEVVKGPFESARKNVALNGLSEKITVRLASGLAAIEPQDEINTITICGMGGTLIAEILAAGDPNKARLILQPNVAGENVRTWLNQNNYKIIAEDILEENEKIYEIIVAECGEQKLSEKEIEFGPFLLQEKNKIFIKKYEHEIIKNERVLANLKNVKNIEKIKQFENQIKKIREIL